MAVDMNATLHTGDDEIEWSPSLKYFITCLTTLVGIQKQALAMGSIIKADQAYEKIDLNPHFIPITNFLSPVDPFAYHLPPECNGCHP